MIEATSALAGRVPKVGAQSRPSREAQNASATAGGACRTSRAPCRATAIRRRTGVNAGVSAAEGHELVVRARLDDAAVLDDDDAVGSLGGREPVRDKDGGAALQ